MATVQDHLENKPEKIRNLFLDLQEKILDLGDDIIEGASKSYISYKRSGKGIFSYIRIQNQKKEVNIELTIPQHNLIDPRRISKSVSHKKRHKSVKTEISLKEIDESEHVFDLVRQCYQFEKQEKFANMRPDDDFPWTRFYESVADKLLGFKDKRNELVEGIHEIVEQVKDLSGYEDTYKDGTTGPLRDICPFTAIGIFNRNHTFDNRKNIAEKLADFLGIKDTVPEHFDGIPTLLPLKAWFFARENEPNPRKPNDIDTLWEIFEKAIEFSRYRDKDVQSAFIAAYDKATKVKNVGWNLTMGLYWIRPWSFLTLDKRSRHYINENFKDIDIPKKPPSASEYLNTVATFENKFRENEFPFNSFPELSLAAWKDRGNGDVTPNGGNYSMDNLAADCFIDRTELERILHRLQTKKNLILQGPPGTGKTWLAKRLAFVLVGQKNNNKVKALQFHPNLSYEDFVHGWRPAGDGKLELVDGPFLQIAEAARKEPTGNYVIVIEEINRGNPAQILGELLTLLEADKRDSDEALELCYSKEDGERFFIPKNLYVIGTMNIADRSLALVDLALRRRFAFVDLEPVFGKPWRNWVHDKFDIGHDILLKIEDRIKSLNNNISSDINLGRQFRIGHSYVTPSRGTPIPDAREWFREVVNTEIGPQLDEYWFDNPEEAEKNKELLLEGF